MFETKNHIFLLLAISTCLLQSSNEAAETVENYADYYRFLKSISSQSSEYQIAKLKTYLEKNPESDRAYRQLLNILLYEGKESEAKHYFLESAAFPERQNNCLWMVAKISAINGDDTSAFQMFRQVILGSSTPTFKLLDDYARFLHENAHRYDGLDEITNLELAPSLENAALAFLCRRRMQFEKAIEILSPEDADSPFILHVLGYCYAKIRRYSEAESYFQKGLKLAESQGDLKFEVYNHVSLGLLARQQNQLDGEIEHYEKALSIAQGINDLSVLPLVQGSLAAHYLAQKKYAEGLQAYCDAIKIAESLKLWRTAAQHYRGKAQALYAMGEFNQVLPALAQNETYALKSNDTAEIYSHLLEKGKFYSHLNLNSLAEHEYEKAYKLGKSGALKHVRYVAATRYADLLVEQEKYHTAREQYLEFITSSDQGGSVYDAYWRWKIAETYYLQKKYDIAYQEFLKAQSLIDRLPNSAYSEYLLANTRLKIADIEVHLGNFAKAKEIYCEDIMASIAQEKNDFAVDLNYGLGNACYGLDEISEAISYYKTAIDVIEESRKDLRVEQFRIGYFSKHIAPYQALIGCYLEEFEKTGHTSDLDTLFYYMEMSRSRSLLDLRAKDVTQNLEESSHQSYERAKKQLQSIQREIRYDPSKYQSLYPEYEAARYQLISTRLRLLEQYRPNSQLSITSLDSVLSNLRHAGMGLLFYHISDHASFALAANAEEVQVIRLDITSDSLLALIDKLLLPFYRLSQPSLDAIPFHAKLAHDLYEILIEPVEERIKLKDRLMIVPDQALRRLPFELLLVTQPKKDTYFPTDSTRYAEDFLLKRYTLLYGPTTLLTKNSVRDSKTSPSILVLANPANPNPGISARTQESLQANWRFAPNLYYADSEGDSIKAVYSRTKILKRNQASMTAFEQQAPRHHILHFATHAFADTVFDAFSGLVLAASEDSTEDGLLMGYEIAELQLDCELVTLSACETGRGKLVLGEGILGLPRQFLRAGARNVLMTLWQVSDQFTLSLMPKFYEALLKNAMTKPGALRYAKMTMLGKSRTDMLGKRIYYQHPFFWAPFSLYGPPDAPREQTEEVPFRLIVLAGILLTMGLTLLYYTKQKKL